MKNALLALIVLAVTISRADRLIYESCGTRREILPPVCGYLVMDTMGNFSSLPNLKYGEAMVLFSDGVHLRYSIIPEPTKDAPVIVYENGKSKITKNSTAKKSLLDLGEEVINTKLTPEQMAIGATYLDEIRKRHDTNTNAPTVETSKSESIKRRLQELNEESEKIKAERDKFSYKYSEEQKRKQNEELRKLWGY